MVPNPVAVVPHPVAVVASPQVRLVLVVVSSLVLQPTMVLLLPWPAHAIENHSQSLFPDLNGGLAIVQDLLWHVSPPIVCFYLFVVAVVCVGVVRVVEVKTTMFFV